MSKKKWQRIGYSWLALKTWVKLWLLWLNLVLWSAAFFLEDPLGPYTLLSLIPAVVILLAIAHRYGGLVRLLGLGHLIPWVPLLIYAELRLSSSWVGPRITWVDSPSFFIWAITLAVSLAICLAFDSVDVIRWYRGERYVLGTTAAFMAKASQRSRRLT